MQLNVQPNYQTTFEIIEYIFRYAAQLVVKRVRTKHKQSRVEGVREKCIQAQDSFVQVLIATVNFIYMKCVMGPLFMSRTSYC